MPLARSRYTATDGGAYMYELDLKICDGDGFGVKIKNEKRREPGDCFPEIYSIKLLEARAAAVDCAEVGDPGYTHAAVFLLRCCYFGCSAGCSAAKSSQVNVRSNQAES